MKCHFVPQSYLRRFRNARNLLETVDLNRSYGATKEKPTRATAQIVDWYVLKGLDALPGIQFIGEKKIEEEYQTLFENDLTACLDRLEAKALLPQDKETIARFVAFQLHRAPVSRSYYREMQKKSNEPPLSKEEQARRSAQIVYGHIGTSISALTLAPILTRSQWLLVRNDGGTPFITSDNPIGANQHASNALRDAEVGQPEMSPAERSARKTAYTISLSPRNVLYINTGWAVDADDSTVDSGRWDDVRTRAYNDLVFRSCLSCVYTVTKDVADDFCKRLQAGEIAQDLFTDDPWAADEALGTGSVR